MRAVVECHCSETRSLSLIPAWREREGTTFDEKKGSCCCLIYAHQKISSDKQDEYRRVHIYIYNDNVDDAIKPDDALVSVPLTEQINGQTSARALSLSRH